MSNKILIVVGGSTKKVEAFSDGAELASFSDLHFGGENQDFRLYVRGRDVADFDVIYIRLIGKRLEEASLLLNYAVEKGVKIVDSHYKNNLGVPLSLSKLVETMRLIQHNIPIPKTYFASAEKFDMEVARELGFPFVIKSTTGRKARDIWAPRTIEELEELVTNLIERQRAGERFFAQEFVEASQRLRVFVIGDQAIGAITRPTKFRKRFLQKVDGEYPQGIKGAVSPVPKEDAQLAINAARAVGIDIAGVDIAKEDNSKKRVVWEVNSAPSWKALAKDTGINIEEKIINYLNSR